MSRVSEADLALAVDAAARRAFEIQRAEVAEAYGDVVARRLSTWDDIGPAVQIQWRQKVLPLVHAALTALADLPDPRYAAWEEGYHASYVDVNAENPYRTEV